jgi:3'-phosphoadenosine 5'-phosphosulfate sulfotransferase (PAPS reductase)/FAD synthetase
LKHVVMFSGGAGSSYEAKLTVEKYGKDNTIILHTPTYAESPDADRFRQQVADYIGLPITVQEDGRSLNELIEDNKILPSNFIPYCTRILKLEQSRKYYKQLQEEGEEFVVHFGYTIDEWRRVQKQKARFESEGLKYENLLFESKISNEEVKNIIKDEWKICLPETYKYLKHNNCIPCYKGSKSHFIKVAKYYPKEYLEAMYYAEKFDSQPFKEITLRELWEQVQVGNEMGSLIEDDFGIPCMCSL